MRFYIGTNKASWLSRTPEPLFVSDRTLKTIKTHKPSAGLWSLDSGGFTELSKYGAWTVGVKEYAERINRYTNEIGGLAWASPQDYMCEPWIIQKTGLSVEIHQTRTVQNFIELQEYGTKTPIIPVLQGWQIDDYKRHHEMYDKAGIDLKELPLVGLGSVCRRQSSNDIYAIVEYFASLGLKLHGYGVKTNGLKKYGRLLTSADSMAWSYGARITRTKLANCVHKAKTCGDCMTYAFLWRDKVLMNYDLAPWSLFDIDTRNRNNAL